jgi:hypothetical protein
MEYKKSFITNTTAAKHDTLFFKGKNSLRDLLMMSIGSQNLYFGITNYNPLSYCTVSLCADRFCRSPCGNGGGNVDIS